MIVYLAVNRVNQKAYVGQTSSGFKVRISNHVSVAAMNRDETPFHRALRKYGSEAFDYAVLESLPPESPRSLINERESHWISTIGCKTPNGYNRADGGVGASGVEYSQERRQRARNAKLGDRNPMKNPVTARKHGDAIRGEKNTLFGMFGPLHPCFGKKHKLSEETKARQKAYFNRPEVKAERRLRMLARQADLNTPEVRAKRSESLRAYWSSQEGRERQRQRMLEIWRQRKAANN